MRNLLLASLLVFGACGGDDGDKPPGAVDAPATADANEQADAPSSDAPMSTGKGLGASCTPSAMSPQGDCDAGFDCLNLQGGTNAWCSKKCVDAMDMSCGQGYSGPGLPYCLLEVTPPMGTAQRYCAVICENGTTAVCNDTQCNGTCPGTLACTGDIGNGAKACR